MKTYDEQIRITITFFRIGKILWGPPTGWAPWACEMAEVRIDPWTMENRRPYLYTTHNSTMSSTRRTKQTGVVRRV